jgi:hypothetical protein
VRINKQFNSWFAKNYKNKDTVEQEHIEEYINSFIQAGKSTNIIVAALKMQFETVLGKHFNWKGLAR